MARTMQNILRIGADNTSLKRVMKESDQLVAKSRGEWKNYTNVLTKELDKINSEMLKMLKTVKNMDDVRAIRKMASDARDLNQELTKMNKVGGGGAGAGGGGLFSKMGGGLMGMLMRVAPALSIIGTGVAAYSARSEMVDTNLQLGGLVGRRGLSKIQHQRNRFGFDPMEQTQAAISLSRQTGGTGGLNDVLAMSRGFGIDVNELSGAAGGFRRAGMSQKQSITALRDTLAAAVAGGLDRSRTGEFIKVTSQMTEELAQQGIAVNSSDIAKLAGTLMAGSQFFKASPQAVQTGLGAVSRLLQSGRGSQFGFAAESLQALSQKKLGRSMGGSELLYELSQGLGGTGTKQLPAQFTAKERLGAVSSSLNQITSGMNPYSRAVTAGSALNMQPAAVQPFLEALDSLSKMTEKEAIQLEKRMTEGQKSPEANALDIMNKTLDGELKGFADYRKEVLMRLGEQIAPTVIEIGRKLFEIGEGISNVASFFGVGKKGLITQASEGIASTFSPEARNISRGIESDAMFRLGDAKSPMSKTDRATLQSVIQRQSTHPQFGMLGKLRTELQAKLDADNSEATKENTRALLELVTKMDTAEQRRREYNALLNAGGRDLGGPVKVTPQGANE